MITCLREQKVILRVKTTTRGEAEYMLGEINKWINQLLMDGMTAEVVRRADRMSAGVREIHEIATEGNPVRFEIRLECSLKAASNIESRIAKEVERVAFRGEGEGVVKPQVFRN